ncbi:MAG: DUF4400 domain-containing protein [Pseudomonadota bacterium]
MIRLVSTLSLLATLMLVLYLPSAYPPQRFLDQIRTEVAMNAGVWTNEHALHILARMLDFQSTSPHVSSVPATAKATTRPNTAVANEMRDVNRRLFNNPYFRSIDALLALAAYRMSALVEWSPIMPAFILAALCDGLLLRIVRSKEFIQHDPELYGLYACAAIMIACATVVALVLPLTVHPMLLPSAPLAIGIFTSRAAAHFHRHG